MDEAEVTQIIRQGMQKAAGYHLECEQDIALFIDFAVLVGADFDVRQQYAWAHDILTDDELSGSAKIALLYDRIPDEAVV